MRSGEEYGSVLFDANSTRTRYGDKIRILKDWMQSASINGLQELTKDWEELSFLESSFASISIAVSTLRRSTKATVVSSYSKSIIRRAVSGDKNTLDQLMAKNLRNPYSRGKHLKTEGQEGSENTEPVLYARETPQPISQGLLRNSYGSRTRIPTSPINFVAGFMGNPLNGMTGHLYQTNQPVEAKFQSQSDDENSVQEFKLERSNTFGDPDPLSKETAAPLSAKPMVFGGSDSHIPRSGSHRSYNPTQKNALWSRIQRKSPREVTHASSLSPQATSLSGILRSSKVAGDQDRIALPSGDQSSNQKADLQIHARTSKPGKQGDQRKVLQTLLATATSATKVSDFEFTPAISPGGNLQQEMVKPVMNLPAIPETNQLEQSPQLKVPSVIEGLFDRQKRATAPKAGTGYFDSHRPVAFEVDTRKQSLGTTLQASSKQTSGVPSRFGPYKLGSGGGLQQKKPVGNHGGNSSTYRHSRTQTSASMVFRAPHVPKGPKIHIVSLASPSSGSQDTPAMSEQKPPIQVPDEDQRPSKPVLVKLVQPESSLYPAGSRPRHRSPRYENIIRSGELALSKIYNVNMKPAIDSGATSHKHTSSMGEHIIEQEPMANLGANQPLNRLHTLGFEEAAMNDAQSNRVSLSSFSSPDSGDKNPAQPMAGFALKMQSIAKGSIVPEDQPLSSIRKPQVTFGEIQSPPSVPKKLEMHRHKDLQALVDFSPKHGKPPGPQVIEEESECVDPPDLISHFKSGNHPPRAPSRPH